ncbi:MAG TPA: hypothetical protein VEA44_14095 [Caulobacter sp.]|nr:hypothetical protein [Caulobacter sp.]
MRALLPIAGLTVLLAACQPPSPKGVDGQTLSNAVAAAVGGENSCVLLVEQGSGKKTFQYGAPSACGRALPSCDPAGGVMNATDLAQLAAQGADRASSCDSAPDGARTVAWASGLVEASPGSTQKLAYAAVMEGPSEQSLPGREMKARLATAFRRAGL